MFYTCIKQWCITNIVIKFRFVLNIFSVGRYNIILIVSRQLTFSVCLTNCFRYIDKDIVIVYTWTNTRTFGYRLFVCVLATLLDDLLQWSIQCSPKTTLCRINKSTTMTAYSYFLLSVVIRYPSHPFNIAVSVYLMCVCG